MADPKGLASGSMVWAKKTSRQGAIESYFRSLAGSFMKDGADENLMVSVPIVLLIDVDGFYVNYNALFDWSSVKNVAALDDFTQPMQMGPLVTWGEEKYGYLVRYYLDDYVEVTDRTTGKKRAGNRKDVAAEMVQYGIDGDIIEFLDGTKHTTTGAGGTGSDLGEEFVVSKETQIIRSMEGMLETYINQYNYSAGRNAGGYKLEMPEVSGEMWHRMLENPTLIAFLQGKSVNNSKEIINTYAYAGAELFKGDIYFITEEAVGRDILKGKENLGRETVTKEYHSLRETYARGQIAEVSGGDVVFNYNGSSYPIDKVYFTMGDCAAEGAVPCPECIK